MTNSSADVELDPSVCYRHPDRQSWVLCQRCGRTVCPECQILAPVGVHCPDCVRETAGGVQWRPAGPTKPPRRGRTRSAGRVRVLLDTDSGGPVATRVILAAAVVLWLAGFFTGNLPFAVLAAIPGTELQIWRFVTAPFASFSSLTFGGVFSFLLSAVFFFLSGPTLERMLGRRRFMGVFVVSSVVGTACMLLTGGVGAGLTAPLFGLFGALLVLVWSDQRTRTQILILIGINLLLSIVTGGGASLPELIGGMIAGAGTIYLFRTAGDRPWKPRTPAVIVVASAAGFVVLAILRALAFS
ncbi:rhomboid family intramembrane serine protease [uncultured Amnibacterium sp.]|uniref:rhomboid family intramembrane serine protease n=1 Tax=uncultured Amnibacterium sp. TaxID=1631851 RepID=UPI0035C9B386